jgi:hypothetical protein
MSNQETINKEEKAADTKSQPTTPADNVPPFLKAIRDLEDFKAEILERIDEFETKFVELEKRINDYDEFFGRPAIGKPIKTASTSKVPDSPPPAQPASEGDVPKHIKDAFKT